MLWKDVHGIESEKLDQETVCGISIKQHNLYICIYLYVSECKWMCDILTHTRKNIIGIFKYKATKPKPGWYIWGPQKIQIL